MNIKQLIDEGFQVKVGKHVNGKGYFANLHLSNGICSWNQSGHGWTQEEALKNAELIIRGYKPLTTYTLADFEKPDNKGIIIWVDKKAIGTGRDQRAVIIETVTSNSHIDRLRVRLLGNGVHYNISPCDIVGVEFDETLTVKFKYNGYTVTS